ncbi:hypothetical protein AVEN_25483-1 [Araneus ventricosus]|uniref:Uncharacterized protein n=1 Tax=Araneus ventricosus TaxID=182803 RepID=A0A4Y2CTH4_ARAVE|nr:hypothetical protein AVEN_25483-1 [Araneus ventricosus]
MTNLNFEDSIKVCFSLKTVCDIKYSKAGHLLYFGIFGTREGKYNRQGRKPMKSGSNGLEVVEFRRTQNPKLHPPIPIWDLDARVPVKQRICLYWDLASRLEMKLEIPRVWRGGMWVRRILLL